MKTESRWEPGEAITIRGAGKQVWWAYPVNVVRDTSDVLAVYLRESAKGMNIDRRTTPEDLLMVETIPLVPGGWKRTDVLLINVPGEAFSVYLMREAESLRQDCWYINLQAPIRRTSIGFDTMDHMLDVVVTPDMSQWSYKDVDEINEAERIGLYSREQARAIWTQAERALNILTSERRAFYEEWKNWKPDPAWKMPELSPRWNEIDPR